MKQLLPQNILLVLAIAVISVTAYYNLSLRQNFGFVIRYDLPTPPINIETVSAQSSEPVELWADEVWDDTFESNLELPDNRPEPVVLFQFPLDINTATVSELVHIPGVGDVTAQRIIQYRNHLGGYYTELIQLMGIRGIGERTFENISPYLFVRGEGNYIHPMDRIEGDEYYYFDEPAEEEYDIYEEYYYYYDDEYENDA